MTANLQANPKTKLVRTGWKRLLLCAFVFLIGGGHAAIAATDEQVAPGAVPTLPYPILFVTQVPISRDFITIGSTFGNHQATMRSVARGGDLWMRYGDGALKNLTEAAGYGSTGLAAFQDANAIAVRDPSVHWDGAKAIFSMVIGAPGPSQVNSYFWQMYEITGLGKDDTPVIAKVPNQPANYNNVSPIYGADDRILFISDRPRDGAAHLYPQLDEYEVVPTNTGVWSLDPATGDLRLLNHAPSGDFTPIVDSFGRVIFTQWDHLQRDQHADADASFGSGQNCDVGVKYGTFNYASESPGALALGERSELFPEPRPCRDDLLEGSNLSGHLINHFFPWAMLEDGTQSEVLNHLGRHELHPIIERSIDDDSQVVTYVGQYPRFNPNRMVNMFQIEESPLDPGTYYGIDTRAFGTHASGQIVRLSAPPGLSADQIQVTYITHRDTASSTPEGGTPSVNHSGHYREPLPLSDGSLIAVHAAETREDVDGNPTTNSRYAFRMKTLKQAGNGFWEADALLTTGISKTLSYWDPYNLVTYAGDLWELNPVEVRPRARPQHLTQPIAASIASAFQRVGVDVSAFQDYLRQNDLALLVTHDVTTRDDLDRQQPFNLRVPDGVQTIGSSGKIYDVAYLQIFQGDLIRGHTNQNTGQPYPGRRVLAQFLHDPAAVTANAAADASAFEYPASVAVASDGSVAAFVPAQRALSWQLLDPAGEAVVRERYWVTFQPGEIRACGSCHGLSDKDQAGQGAPSNEPDALLQLLAEWSGNEIEPYELYLPLLSNE